MFSESNACSLRNGGCQQICLATPTSRRCACSPEQSDACLPGIEQSPLPVTVNRHSSTVLHCLLRNESAVGVPYLSVEWIRNGTVVKTYNHSSLPLNFDAVLAVASVTPTDTGTYVCRVSNRYGTVNSSSAVLTISGNCCIR